mgnify:CR=1 FL=1
MYVSDYLSHIVKGEVKQLYVSDIGTTSPNTVQQANIDTLISYLNEANLELHKHFGLLQKELVLTDVTNNSLHNVPLDFLYAISAQYDDGTEVSINNERANYVDKVDENVSILFPAPFKILVKSYLKYLPSNSAISKACKLVVFLIKGISTSKNLFFLFAIAILIKFNLLFFITFFKIYLVKPNTFCRRKFVDFGIFKLYLFIY